jgi:ribose transport system ATP-binding protein
VHALIGENGAGKSTLMKVLSGAIHADEGTILLNQQDTVIASPAAGRSHGIAMIYQELILAPHLSVEDNLTLGMEQSRFGFKVSQKEAMREALEWLGYGDLDITKPVRELSISVQQILEVARSLMSKAEIIIMDEPTSSLTASDTKQLFTTIQQLKERGISIIYISHFLEEVMEIADHYTVLRDGETVSTGRVSDTSIPEIIHAMVGRELDELYPKRTATPGEPILEINALSGTPLPEETTFTLHRGEIFGIAGLVGAGRSEMVRTLFGLDKAKKGELTLHQTQSVKLLHWSPGKARAHRMDLLSENRKEEGLASSMTIADNTTLSTLHSFARWKGFGFLQLKREKQAVQNRINELSIRCESPNQLVDQLSGGNQQKVAFARILEQDADIILLDEPTRGVDVASKAEIYQLIHHLADQGKGIVFVSSYLPELLGVCESLAVMHRGRLSEKQPAHQWTEHSVMEAATSGF